MKLDWSHWLYGLGSGFIGGGAGAVSAVFVAAVQTPEKYNFGRSEHGLQHVLVLMLGTFLVSGVLTAFAYLKQSPLPVIEDNGKAGPKAP